MNRDNQNTEPLLRLENLNKTFTGSGTDLTVLNNLNLTVNRGDFISIQGASGIGKSTLLYIMGLLDVPSRGDVYFKGENITGMSDKKLSLVRNQEIGFIFQFHHLLPDFTAWENVIIPLKIGGSFSKKNEEYAREIIDIVGMQQRLQHLPSELSGGERQRIALARSLVNNPSVLLADEPSGNLDARNTEILHSMLKRIHQDLHTTLVLVTHDKDLAGITHQKYNMHNGIIELI